MEPSEPVERTESINDERPAPQVTSVPKKSKAPKVLGVLLVLALIGCGALGWMSYDQSNQKASLQTKTDAKDEKIAVLESQLKSAKATIKENSSESEDTTTDTSSMTNDELITMALSFAKAKVTNRGFPEGATDLRAEIDKQTSTFTRVQVGSQAAGPGVGLVYFKKVGSDWVLLGDDNGNQTRFNESFGMPSNF